MKRTRRNKSRQIPRRHRTLSREISARLFHQVEDPGGNEQRVSVAVRHLLGPLVLRDLVAGIEVSSCISQRGKGFV